MIEANARHVRAVSGRASQLRLNVGPAVAAILLATQGVAAQTGRAGAALEPLTRQTPGVAPWLWGRLAPGPFPVGLRTSRASDSDPANRSDDAPRTLEVVLWYPAASGRNRPVRFDDYVRLSIDPPLAFGQAVAVPATRNRRRHWLNESVTGDTTGLENVLTDRILDTPMAAVRDAEPAVGKFPAVLWSARHATPAAQAVLSEYLASHGYLVATVRGLGPLRPFPWENVPRAAKTAVLRSLVAELRRTTDWLLGLTLADGRLAVAAWSYGGESAALLQLEEPRVRAVLSLSSSVFNWVYQGHEQLDGLDPAGFNVPYVLMVEGGDTDGKPRDRPPIMDRLPATGVYLRLPTLGHGNFNVLEGMIPGVAGIDRVPPWSRAGPEARTGYEAISRYVLAFLDRLLRDR